MITGKFHADYVRENIFEPLGMKTARIVSDADIVPNRVAGYRMSKDRILNQDWVSPTFNQTADAWILEPSATELYVNRICTSLPRSLRIA